MSRVLILILPLLILAASWTTTAAINCGSSLPAIIRGIQYQSDEGFSSNSQARSHTRVQQIQDESLKPLFLNERTVTSGETLSYKIKLQGEGRYLLVLTFIELTERRPRKRVFEVRLGDENLKTLDIFNEVGRASVYQQEFRFDLHQDILYMDNLTRPLLNAFEYKREVIVLNLVSVVGSPKIEAILVIKSDFGPNENPIDFQDFRAGQLQTSRKEVVIKGEQLRGLGDTGRSLLILAAVTLMLYYRRVQGYLGGIDESKDD